jgi:predicted ATPase
LFTDIEGSTQLWSDAPEVMARALARHDEIVRSVIAAHRGVLFSTSGDGSAACFGRASDAVSAALEAQLAVTAERWPPEARLRVRMGLHTGEADERDGDYFGPVVNLAARVMGAGGGGQILATATTADVLGRAADVEVVRLGRFHLRGIADAVEIVGFHGRGLPWLDLVPTASPAHRLVRLPAARIELVGRAGLVEEIERIGATHRLVTLVGPGGVGKTSVAVEAAHRVADTFDRSVFVDLTTIDSNGDVGSVFAAALGTTSPLMASLAMSVRSERVLLVVDNCEHVLDGVAELVDQLLAAAPDLHVLTTTRELLGVPGERVVAVPPLQDDAALVALFRERAAAAGGPPIPDEADGVVLELCHRLDGLPLAVELAASRTVALTPGELLARLDDRLRLLDTGRRRGRDRHRTLRETIDWSFDLLSPAERDVYRHLAVFVDWFDLADAAAVCARTELDTVELLHGLVAKSLLVRAEQREHGRFRFLESIRDHAWQELDRVGAVEPTMNRMVDRMITRLTWLAEQVWDSADGPPVEAITDLLPTHRRAAQWCITTLDFDRGARLFTPFATMLYASFPLALPPAVDLAMLAPPDHPAMELELVALLSRMYQGHFRDYRPRITRIVALVGTWQAVPATVLPIVSYVAGLVGDYDTGAEAVRLQIDDSARGQVAAAAATSYDLLRGGGTVDDLDQIVATLRHVSTPFARATVLSNALLAAQVVAPERIGKLAAQIEGVCPGVVTFELHRRQCLGEWHLVRNELPDALRVVAPSIASAHRRGELSMLVPLLVLHALVLQALDRPEDAARISGRLPRHWSLYHTVHIESFWHWLDARTDSQTRTTLAAEGATADLDQLFLLAPNAVTLSGSTTLDPAVDDPLEG